MNNINGSVCYFGVTDKENAYQVSYEVTNLCNLKCAHCMNNSKDDADKGLCKEDIKNLIDDLIKINVSHIYITGGEPTLYPNFIDMLKYAKEKKIPLFLATNGYEIENHIDVIKEYISGVFISLDGLPEIHNKLRGVENAFQKTEENIKTLVKNGIPTRISTVIWNENFDTIEDLVVKVKNMGTYQIHFTILVPAGRSKENDVLIDNKKYNEIITRIDELSDKYSDENFIVSSRRNRVLNQECEDCMAGKKMIHLNSKGEVFPCSWIAKSPLKDKYKISWNNGNISECIKKSNEFQDLVDKRRNMYGYSGCPAISSIYNNDELSEDPLNGFLLNIK